MFATLLLACNLLSYLILAKHLGQSHPATWFSLGWTALVLIHLATPLGLYPISLLTAFVIVVGVWSFGLGALSVKRTVLHPKFQPPISTTILTIWAIIVTAALVYGVHEFQVSITTAVGVQDFSSLDATKIRFAQTLGTVRGGGVGGLMFAMSPLVACLGLLGGMRVSRGWFALVPLAFWASAQSPGRTFTLGLMATMLPFYFYIRTTSRPMRLNKVKVTSIALGTLTAAFVYFNSIGQSLGKNQALHEYLGDTKIPDFLASPIVYQIGGMSALSKAQDTNFNPGEFGRNIFALIRIAAFLGFPVHVPDTITNYVLVPFPFNVYTGFGDVWSDFGTIGVAIAFFAMGALAAHAHRRALEGRLNWAWVSSMLMSVLASTPLTLRILYLDFVTVMTLGIVVFASITIGGRRAMGIPRKNPPDSTPARTQSQDLSDGATPRLTGLNPP